MRRRVATISLLILLLALSLAMSGCITITFGDFDTDNSSMSKNELKELSKTLHEAVDSLERAKEPLTRDNMLRELNSLLTPPDAVTRIEIERFGYEAEVRVFTIDDEYTAATQETFKSPIDTATIWNDNGVWA